MKSYGNVEQRVSELLARFTEEMISVFSGMFAGAVGLTARGTRRNSPDEAKDLQAKVVKFLTASPAEGKAAAVIAKETGTAPERLTYALQQLQKKGQIQKSGNRRTMIYMFVAPKTAKVKKTA